MAIRERLNLIESFDREDGIKVTLHQGSDMVTIRVHVPGGRREVDYTREDVSFIGGDNYSRGMERIKLFFEEIPVNHTAAGAPRPLRSEIDQVLGNIDQLEVSGQ